MAMKENSTLHTDENWEQQAAELRKFTRAGAMLSLSESEQRKKHKN